MELIISQVEIIENLPFPKDILQIINEYFGGSISIYIKWAKKLYYGYMSSVIGERISMFNDKDVIRRMVDIFVDMYGKNIKELSKKFPINEKYYTITQFNYKVAKKIYLLFYYDFSGNGPDSMYSQDELANKLDGLWEDYRDPFFKAVLEKVDLEGSLHSININLGNDYFYNKVHMAYKQGCNPFNMDYITGKSFIPWIFSRSISYQNNDQKANFENLILEILIFYSNKGNYDKESPIVNMKKLFFKSFRYVENTKDWPNNLAYKILKLIDLSKLEEDEHENLIYKIVKFKNKDLRLKFLRALKNQNFNFNYINVNGDTCLFNPYFYNDHHFRIITELISMGADPNIKNKYRQTPFERLEQIFSGDRDQYAEICKMEQNFNIS